MVSWLAFVEFKRAVAILGYGDSVLFHSLALFGGIRLSPQTSKTSESTAISEIRRQLNSILTYSLLTVLLGLNFFKKSIL